jgi:hypothetical protein
VRGAADRLGTEGMINGDLSGLGLAVICTSFSGTRGTNVDCSMCFDVSAMASLDLGNDGARVRSGGFGSSRVSNFDLDRDADRSLVFETGLSSSAVFLVCGKDWVRSGCVRSSALSDPDLDRDADRSLVFGIGSSPAASLVCGRD